MKSATGSSSFYVCWGSRVELNADNSRNCFFQQGKQSQCLSEKSEVTIHNFSKGLKAKCLCRLSEVKPHLNRRQKIEAHYCREWTTIDHRKFYFPDYMVGGVVRITGESGPPRGNSVVYVAYKKKSSLSAKVKLLKADTLYLRGYNNNTNNNNVL